jgi:hypothetical protein
MSTTAAVITLASVALALELAGGLLVVREIWRDRQRAGAILSYVDAPITYVSLEGFDPSSHPPELVERVQRYKEALARPGVVVRERDLREAKKAMHALALQDINGLGRRMNDEVNELKDGLRAVLAGSARTRLLGVVLIGVGACCGAAATSSGRSVNARLGARLPGQFGQHVIRRQPTSTEAANVAEVPELHLRGVSSQPT